MSVIPFFSKSKVTVEGRITRVDGSTDVCYGTSERGVLRTLLLRMKLWLQLRTGGKQR